MNKKNNNCQICGKLCYGKRCKQCFVENILNVNNIGNFNEGHKPWNKGKKGLQSHSEETKRKMSKARKNIKKSEEHKKNIGIAHKGRKILWGDKISNTLKLKYKNGELDKDFLKKHRLCHPEVSMKQSKSLKKFYQLNPEKHLNSICREKGFISKPQKELYNIIRMFNSDAELEYHLKLKNSSVFGDIVISKEKLWFEYDGSYWHDNIEQKRKDKIRQKKIENKGFNVIRVDEKRLDILKNNLNEDLNIRRFLYE